MKIMSKNKTKTKVLECGPLESVFPGSKSKILDFLLVFREWDYSISDIAKSAGLSFKTALNEIRDLEKQQIVTKTRTVGKATMYKFNIKSKQGFYINKLAFELATKRIDGSIKKITA
jgi:hypothetical protein